MPNEPYGAQLLRRVNDDSAALAHEYDELLRNTEDPHVKSLVTKSIVRHLKTLDELRAAWFSSPRLKQLPPPHGLEPFGPGEAESDFDEEWGDLNPRSRQAIDRFLDLPGAEEFPEELPPLDQEEEEPGLGHASVNNAEYAAALTDGFRKAVDGAAGFLESLHEQPEEPDDDLRAMFDPLRPRQRKQFPRDQQAEARRRAGDLDQFAGKVKDPAVLDAIQEAIDLLRGLVESRQATDSTEPLAPHELDQIGFQAKSLRSILHGKRGRWPKGAIAVGSPKHGRKSLDTLAADTAAQNKALETLQSDLQRLAEMF